MDSQMMGYIQRDNATVAPTKEMKINLPYSRTRDAIRNRENMQMSKLGNIETAMTFSSISALEENEMKYIISLWLESQLGICSCNIHFITERYRIQATTEYTILDQNRNPIIITDAEKSRLHIELDDYIGMYALHWDPLCWISLRNFTHLEPVVDDRGIVIVSNIRMKGMSVEELQELRSEIVDVVLSERSRGSLALEGEASSYMVEVARQWEWTIEEIEGKKRSKNGIPRPIIYKILRPPPSFRPCGGSYRWLLQSLDNIYNNGMPLISYFPVPSLDFSLGILRLRFLVRQAYREMVEKHNPYLYGMENLVNIGSDGIITLPLSSPSDLEHFNTNLVRWTSLDNYVGIRDEASTLDLEYGNYTDDLIVWKGDSSMLPRPELPIPELPPSNLVIDESGAIAFIGGYGSYQLVELEDPTTPTEEDKMLIQKLWLNGRFTTLWGHYMWNTWGNLGLLYCHDTLKYRDWEDLSLQMGTM